MMKQYDCRVIVIFAVFVASLNIIHLYGLVQQTSRESHDNSTDLRPILKTIENEQVCFRRRHQIMLP